MRYLKFIIDFITILFLILTFSPNLDFQLPKCIRKVEELRN